MDEWVIIKRDETQMTNEKSELIYQTVDASRQANINQRKSPFSCLKAHFLKAHANTNTESQRARVPE